MLMSSSDILTPLPAMGIDFTMVESKGPKILNPIKGREDIDRMKLIEDGNSQIPFIGQILKVEFTLMALLCSTTNTLDTEEGGRRSIDSTWFYRSSMDSCSLLRGGRPVQALHPVQETVQ